MKIETWYELEDGRVVDPNECVSDAKGVLTHSSGAKVAMRFPDCPMSRSVDADRERAKAARAAAKDMKPEDTAPAAPKPGYRTRESKAD